MQRLWELCGLRLRLPHAAICPAPPLAMESRGESRLDRGAWEVCERKSRWNNISRRGRLYWTLCNRVLWNKRKESFKARAKVIHKHCRGCQGSRSLCWAFYACPLHRLPFSTGAGKHPDSFLGDGTSNAWLLGPWATHFWVVELAGKRLGEDWNLSGAEKDFAVRRFLKQILWKQGDWG